MNRRGILKSAALALAPATAVASAPVQIGGIEQIRTVLAKAGVHYEDNVANDEARSYFYGVLSGLMSLGMIHDFAVTPITGVAGSIADIVVRVEGGWVYFPIRYSEDYWDRKNRLENLRSYNTGDNS